MNCEGVEIFEGGQFADSVKRLGYFEPETISRWSARCLPGATVIDVGAHVGVFSIIAAKLGAHPIALEPMPETFKLMMLTADLNGVIFEAHQVAAADRQGTAVMGYRTDVALPYGASLKRASKPGHEQITVRTIALDDLDAKNVTAIKIDVERAEEDVLLGAKKTVRTWKPEIMVECLSQSQVKRVEAVIGSSHRFVKVLDGRNYLFKAIA